MPHPRTEILHHYFLKTNVLPGVRTSFKKDIFRSIVHIYIVTESLYFKKLPFSITWCLSRIIITLLIINSLSLFLIQRGYSINVSLPALSFLNYHHLEFDFALPLHCIHNILSKISWDISESPNLKMSAHLQYFHWESLLAPAHILSRQICCLFNDRLSLSFEDAVSCE